MPLTFILCCLTSMISIVGWNVDKSSDYSLYHDQINNAELLLSKELFTEALSSYEQVFEDYEFVFLRDYKVATQLALHLDNKEKAYAYLRKGIASGWEIKDIKKNDFIKPLLKGAEWNTIEQSYDKLHAQFETRIDSELRIEVRHMFKKDQKKAMGALFRIGNQAQEKYGTKKFAPHSERQINALIVILTEVGYPGEKIIGNDYWMSTIISHHNSISLEYSRKDTLYTYIRPKLLRALNNGELSPYEFALVEDWHLAVSSERRMAGYGFLNPPKKSTLSETDGLRQTIGMRSIELRNRLVDLEEKTGMKIYLPDWIKGKIAIE